MGWHPGYVKFIEDNLTIVDKEAREIPFVLNPIQRKFMLEDATNRSIVLKARQQGFSSVNLASFVPDFLLKENVESVVLADNSDNALTLLSRVKSYLKSYLNKFNYKEKDFFEYNSKYEMTSKVTKSRFSIGTAENTEFGRSRTITNLLMTEAAFYPDFQRLLAGALQAVTPGGRVVIETTANGFNQFKEFWDRSVAGETGFTPLFYPADGFYTPEFLAQKRQELGNRYAQEYPTTAIEAFLTSGEPYFNPESLAWYLTQAREVVYA